MNSELALFLLVGVVVVAVSGRLLSYSGKRYVATSESDSQGKAAATLASIPFYLATLGLVALIGVLPFDGSPERNFLLRIGMLLIALAIVYGIAVSMFHRRRQEEFIADADERMAEARKQHKPVEYSITNDPPPLNPEPLHEVDPEPKRRDKVGGPGS